jgi:hypothetical protein
MNVGHVVVGSGIQMAGGVCSTYYFHLSFRRKKCTYLRKPLKMFFFPFVMFISHFRFFFVWLKKQNMTSESYIFF